MKMNLLKTFVWIGLILTVACSKKTAEPTPPSDGEGEETEEPTQEGPATLQVEDTFTNPLIPRGADPWVIQQNGMYYFTYTQGSKLVLYATKYMSELAAAERFDAWIPPSGMPYSKNIWAPEMHQINGKWYIYFAADDGGNANHRMYVVENSSEDPLQGEWVFKGKVADTTDQWAIDGTILQYKAQLYMIWSGGNAGAAPQRIYLAKMSDPWTISSERVVIAEPTYPWEKNGSAINEGPEVLINNSGNVFVAYSGSGYWVDTYCLGLLSLKADGDPMNATNWTKNPTPVFLMSGSAQVYGPGHNGFFKSPDGKEDWMIYHARNLPQAGDNNPRKAHIQSFTWKADGTPNFGDPLKIDEPIKKPSGEPVRFLYPKENWTISGFSSEEPNNNRLADKLIDGDVSTYWITRYSSDPTNYPDHWITVDMGEEQDVDGFIIAQKAGDRKVKEIELSISQNNTIWESLGIFYLNNADTATQYLNLQQQKNFRYFKLVPKTGHDTQMQPGLAEVGVFKF